MTFNLTLTNIAYENDFLIIEEGKRLNVHLCMVYPRILHAGLSSRNILRENLNDREWQSAYT